MKKKRSLARICKEFWPATILTPIFVIGEVAFDVLIPLMTGKLLDEGVKAGSMHHIAAYGLTVVGMFGLALICGGLSGRFGAKASTGFARNLRREMYRNVQKFSFANIDKFSTSGIITRLTTDVTNVQMAFMMVIRIAVRSPIMLICAWVLTLRINPKLALIFLVVIPILGIGLALIMTRAHPIFERVFKRYDHLNNVVQENLLGIRVVKSFVREAHEEEKFAEKNNGLKNSSMRAFGMVVINMPVMMLVVYSTIIAVMWFGGKMVYAGTLPVGDLTAFFTYITQILMSLMMVSMMFMMMTRSIACAKRIVEVLDERPAMTDDSAKADAAVKDGSIDFDHVFFKYSETSPEWVLKDVNIHIPSGATVGILGGTGSGKTSLMSLIPRLYEAQEGTVSVGGRPVADYTMEHLRESVSVVLQKNTLFSGTIRENLLWGDPNATEDQLWTACRAACADEFLERMPDGLDTDLGQGGVNVSGGQKQRLCIARAILKKPKVLILDDSTSAVDTATDAKIRQAFRQDLPGTTKLIVAQRVTSVMDADLILVMDDGAVAAQGTHEELMKTCEIYREVYESQQEGQHIGG